jgi:hypothetical protein
MKRKTVLFVILSTVLIFSGWDILGQRVDGSQEFAHAAWGGRPIRVMTRNIYVGTDVDTVMGFLMTNPTLPEVMEMVELAYNMLLYTDFPTRAKALAEEIVCTRPDLIGLQEVYEVRKQTPGDGIQGDPDLMEMQFDYLEILLKELKKRGRTYEVAKVIQNVDVEMPMFDEDSPTTLTDVRITDYDVILYRPGVKILESSAKNYEEYMKIPGGYNGIIEILRGYVSVRAKINGKKYRFVNTHLEPFETGILLAQAKELIASVTGETLPTILVGDFNTEAPTDPTYQYIVDEGFVDVWTRNLLWWNILGLTSGFKADLLFGPWLDDPNDPLEKRIDLIFARSNIWFNTWQIIGPVFAIVVGDNPEDMTPTGLWPSDHAGVVARLCIPR